jgi:hypothetical protein
MKLHNKLLTLVAVCAIGAMPLALAGGATAHPGHPHPGKGHTSTHQSSSSSAAAPNGHAWGRLCARMGEKKQHVDGQRGTPFSRCVTAMAKLAHGTKHSPSVACSSESKKHVAGQKGTPFSDCVAAGAKLLQAEKHS